MIRTILVPLDGSRTAEHALPWARFLSRRTGAGVRLARVRRIPPAPVAGEGMTTYDPDPHAYITNEENEYTAAIAKTWLDPDSETTLTAELLEPTDSIAGTLIRYAESVAADLTLMTSRSHGPMSRFLFGSVADDYLRRAPGPTLLVQGDAATAPDPTVEPRVGRVVVPLDGSALSEQAVTPALTLFDWYGCEITLLLVLDAVDDLRQLMERVDGLTSHHWTAQSALPIASEYLQRVADRLRQETSKVRTKVVEHGSAADAILAEAADPTTAVALATHGRGGLTRMIFGSVADKVVRGAAGPVMVVRPKRDE
ncbi:MAG: universal stress protein [Fimbriiglobus sp.]|jgi:nucleotide-binding universal stress UspA family protein|nr:universal stress protein [Fimbriiglobus sp.]